MKHALHAGLGEPARHEIRGLVTALDRRLVGLPKSVERRRRLPKGLVVGCPEQRMADRKVGPGLAQELRSRPRLEPHGDACLQ